MFINNINTYVIAFVDFVSRFTKITKPKNVRSDIIKKWIISLEKKQDKLKKINVITMSTSLLSRIINICKE